METKMSFTTDVRVKNGQSTTVDLPDMTGKFLVPYKFTLWTLSGPKDNQSLEKSECVTCRVFAGPNELYSLGEPHFLESNVVDLTPMFGIVEKFGRVKLTLTNKTREPCQYQVATDYCNSLGGVLFQEKVDTFDTVIGNVCKLGKCTKINLGFDEPVNSLRFLTTSNCTKGNWIESFEADTEDTENKSFCFDFTDKDLLAYYHNLEYLTLRIEPVNKDSSSFSAYVTAWGFPSV